MKTENHGPIGCVLIDDCLSGTSRLSGLSSFLESKGISLHALDWSAAWDLLSALQMALQVARSAAGNASAVAWGTGCCAALALAEQLPVERLVLIDPKSPRSALRGRSVDALSRQMVRLERFAERNLPLCVSDVLVVRPQQSKKPRARSPLDRARRPHGRLVSVEIPGADAKNLYTNCENALANGIYTFLKGGVFPKSLAEKSEMCIIDG